MCYGSERFPTIEVVVEIRAAANANTAAVEILRGRIAETEARLERARAKEAEMNRRLDEMKKFVRVMEILETYLRRRYREQQEYLIQLYSSPPSVLVPSK